MTETVWTIDHIWTVSGLHAMVVPLAAVCLCQYLLQLHYSRRSRRESGRIRAELHTITERVADLEQDRILAATESRLLRMLADTVTSDEAIQVALEFFAPDPQTSLALFVDLPAGRPAKLRAARGINDRTRPRVTVDAEWRDRLALETSLHLKSHELERSAFHRRLAPEDQEKISQLHLFRVGITARQNGALIVSDLPPRDVELAKRKQLAERIIETMDRLRRRTENVELQQDELRVTRELLELRCLVDTHAGNPIELLEEYLQRVIEAAEFDRATLYLAAGTRLDRTPLVATKSDLPRGIADLWRLDEVMLSRRGLTAESPVFHDSVDLQARRVRSSMRGAFVAPLLHDGAVIGVVCLSRQSEEALAEPDAELLHWAIDYLHETILRTVDRALMEQQASRDALTRLANRHTFDREIARCVESPDDSECALIMFDIDHFKSLNDRYGHLAGDEVLRRVAGMVQSCVSRAPCSKRSLVARYGGEELAVVLPEATLDDAFRIAEDVLATARNMAVPFEHHTIRLTISAGVAVSPRHGITPSDLIAAADGALYHAKNHGRDRCEVAVDRYSDRGPILGLVGS